MEFSDRFYIGFAAFDDRVENTFFFFSFNSVAIADVLQLLLRHQQLKRQQNNLQALLCSERWLVGPSGRDWHARH